MTLDDIKAAVDAGKTVHQHHDGYTVIKDRLGQYLIECNGHYIGLTAQDGVRMNGHPDQFFVAEPEHSLKAR